MNTQTLKEIRYLEGRLIEMRKDFPLAGEGKKKFLIALGKRIHERLDKLKETA